MENQDQKTQFPPVNPTTPPAANPPATPATSATGRRLRGDATWNRLTPEQQEAVEYWLFEERLSYVKVQAQLKERFALEVSDASVCRMYQSRARERQRQEIVRTMASARDLDELPVTAEELCAVTLRAVGTTAMHVAREHPERVRELVSLARVLLENESVELRRRRLDQADGRRYYPPVLSEPQQRLAAVLKNPDLSEEEKLAQMEAMRSGGTNVGGGLKGGYG